MKKKVLITTAIDYVDDVIHIGHAYQKILADCIARIERLRRGEDNVFFVTGTDEHGQKVFKAAQEKGIEIEKYVEDIAKKDQAQQDALNISYDRFIRTTDSDHIKLSLEFFKKVYDAGYIYKGTYKGFYCEGCEGYKTEKDLEDGKCSLHPTKEIQTQEEENYFFKFSEFKGFLKELFDSNPDFVIPTSRFNEMYNFIDQIEDIPITRRKEKLPWGIECPVDKDHVIWVWFDALINYLTFGLEVNAWDKDTEIIHVLGKDNARFHALLWPAMLKAAGYEIPTHIYVNAFLSLNGKKISKSLGNIIRPTDLTEKYGTDPVRYYFLRYGPIVEDSDFNETHFKVVFNGDLANGIGNTVARLAKLAEKAGLDLPVIAKKDDIMGKELTQLFSEFRVDLIAVKVWEKLADIDKHINENEPWVIEDEKKLREVLSFEINALVDVAFLASAFIPETSEKILKIFSGKVTYSEPLFPRL